MSIKIASTATRKLRSTVMFVASFALALGSVSFAAPQFFSQIAHAVPVSPLEVSISNITELRSAVEGQADGQTWTINAGDYGLDRFNDITAGGETGWYLPITASHLTINGVGNPTLFGQEYSANGNWSSQNLVSVFGDNVTINGLTLMPKADPNKTVEVIGNDFTLEDTTITPNTKIADSVYDNIANPSDKAFAKQWGGSIYFSHAGNHLLKNVIVNNAGISFRYTPSNTHITFDNVNIVNRSNDNDTNGYRYSSDFNNVGNTIVGAPKVTYDVDSTLGNLDSVLAGARNGDTVNINSNLSTDKQVTITQALTINGNRKTISPTFRMNTTSNNSIIGIQSDGVTVNNLVVDGTGGTNLHGINVYVANGVNLNDVTIKNNRYNGLVVNSSTVTVSNIHTSGNGWGGIDVDQKASPSSSLTVNGQSTHSEAAADIYVDNTTKAVAVHDTNSQYNSHTSGLIGRPNDLVYKLKLAVPTNLTPVDGTYTNNPAFVNSWSNVADATGYEYRTANTMSGDVLGTIVYSDSNLTQPGRYSTSGGTETRQNGGAPQGNYYWQVRATGPSGRVSDWSAINKVTVDTTVPATPNLLTPTNDGFVNTNNFNFTWTNSAGGGSPVTYEFQSDGNDSFDSPWDSLSSAISEQNNLTTPQIHSTGAPDGTYYWRVRSLDAAGNKSAWTDAWKMTIDTQKPAEPTATLKANGVNVLTNGYANSNTFTFNLSATGATRYQLKYWNDITGSSFKVNNPWNPTSLSTVYPDNFTQGEGTHYFAFSACDAAGNCSAYSTPFVVTYDKTAPDAAIAGVTSGQSVSGDVALQGVVTDQNPMNSYFSITSPNKYFQDDLYTDGRLTHDYLWKTGALSNGTYKIQFETRDKANNKDAGSTVSLTVVVDNPKPVVTALPVPPPTTQVIPVTPIVGAAPYATAAPAANAATTPAGEVLGASTTKQDAPAVAGAQTSKDVAAEPTAKDGFNSAWYWLLAIPVAGAAWWALAAFRRREV